MDEETRNWAKEEAKKIGLWLYGPDEGQTEGVVRTLIDKISAVILEGYERGRQDEREAVKMGVLSRLRHLERGLNVDSPAWLQMGEIMGVLENYFKGREAMKDSVKP